MRASAHALAHASARASRLPRLLLCAALLRATSGAFRAASSILALRAGVAGDGTLAGSLAAPQFVDELDAATGALLSSVALPTARSGAGGPAVAAYVSKAEGLFGPSGDGTLLVVTGYDAPARTYFPKGETWAAVPRALALVNCSGGVAADTSVADASLTTGNLRHATTFDGSYFFLATELDGLLFVRRGGSERGFAAARVDSPNAPLASPRYLSVEYDGAALPQPRYQLLASGAGGVNAVGNGLPVLVDPDQSRMPNFLPGPLQSPSLGTVEQWARESPTSIWLAQPEGVAHWALAGGAWAPGPRKTSARRPPSP